MNSSKRKQDAPPSLANRKRVRLESQKLHTWSPNASTKMDNLPKILSVEEYVEARMFEIKSLEKALVTATQYQSQRVFQTLSRHLRRRAASHNIKRIPTKYRASALKELEKDNEQGIAHKRALIAKKRRIPRKVVDEYKRRQKSKLWLETHVWHAKRFKMIDLWGFRLPLHPNDKAIKPSYKACSHQCMIQDVSYERIIEVSGIEEEIIQLFKAITDPTEASIGSARFTSGIRQGELLLYSPNSFPLKQLGPVHFLWRQQMSELDKNSRKLWLWVHPSIYNDVDNMLTEHSNFAELKSVQIKPLHSQLVQFELTGPRSHATIHRVLDLVSKQASFGHVINDDSNQLWSEVAALRSTSLLSPGVVLGLTVFDPRLSFPKKMPRRGKSIEAHDLANIEKYQTEWPNNVAESNIWDELHRETLEKSKLKQRIINKRKEENLIPGTHLTPSADDSILPILLINHQDSKNYTKHIEAGSGWRVVIPATWGMAFWMSFVFCGARVGGLRERRHRYLECESLFFPFDYPGTDAFSQYHNLNKEQLRNDYEKKPPAKRPNFSSLKIMSPFAPDFSLVSETDTSWTVSSSKLLALLKDITSKISPTETIPYSELILQMENLINSALLSRNLHSKVPNDHVPLVSIHLVSLCGGIPQDRAVVCVPEAKDYALLNSQMNRRRDYKKEVEQAEVERGLNLPTVGYVTSGNTSFYLGKGSAIATVTAKALYDTIILFKRCQADFLGKRPILLYRNTTHRHCWPAEIHW